MTITRIFALMACATLMGCAEKAGPWLVDGTGTADLSFTYESGDRGERWLPAIMGGGVALFDYDGDGDLDLYFTNGNDDPLSQSAGGPQSNRLFRQQADGAGSRRSRSLV